MAAYYVAFLFSAIRESAVVSLRSASEACAEPLLISWCNLNAAGTTKRVVTTATMFGALTIGNVSFRIFCRYLETPLIHILGHRSPGLSSKGGSCLQDRPVCRHGMLEHTLDPRRHHGRLPQGPQQATGG